MSKIVDTKQDSKPLNVSDILIEEFDAIHKVKFEMPKPAAEDTPTPQADKVPAPAVNETAKNPVNKTLIYFYKFLHKQALEDDRHRQVPPGKDADLHYAEKRNERAALCLSGGGIRSATFNLGILQELARLGLLAKFEYLSTVSGGGYIGSWLKTWMHRESVDSVIKRLYETRTESPLSPEPERIEFLRDYSNYLSPKLGLFSADTWTLVALYLRNLLLNWLVMIPLAAAFLALPRVVEALNHYVKRTPTSLPSTLTNTLLAGGSAAALMAIAYRNRYQPSSRRDKDDQKNTNGQFLRLFLTPLTLAACLFALAWASWSPHIDGRRYCCIPVVACVLLNLIGWICNWKQMLCSHGTTTNSLLNSLLGVLVSGSIAGLCIWLVVYEFFPDPSVQPVLYASLAAPLFLSSFLLGSVVWAGFTSRFSTNADLEWWARDGAWVLIAIVVWIVTSLLVLAGPALFLYFQNVWGRGILTAILPASGAVTASLGKSGSTPANDDEARKLQPSSIVKQHGLMVAALLFVVAFAIALSYLTDTLLNLLFGVGVRFPTNGCQHYQSVTGTQLGEALVIAIGLLVVGAIAGRFVDVNKFSLHQSYRNRLVRAYLGASNLQRKTEADQFTGFDEHDNLPMHELVATESGPLNRPFHVINIALNLVATDKLSWQQRKAESFTVTTLHAGCHNLGYRHSSQYPGGLDHGTTQSTNGALSDAISIGTAMAISGAAASPNEGYQSSPLIGLIMAFFNVRLGAWLQNPAFSTMPKLALSNISVIPIIQEALGLTNDTSSHVYLSDGGHFENLGIYEMVLRRCRYIVVGDAGCDPDCTFEDLGNAIRNIRIDLGISIDLSATKILSRTKNKPGAYYAVGTIDYSTVDGPDAWPGTLIYLKPAFYGTEPTDVYNYGQQSASFPHETTLDQFFTESQFESYRSLGAYLLRRIYKPNEHDTKPSDFNEFAKTVTENSGVPAAT